MLGGVGAEDFLDHMRLLTSDELQGLSWEQQACQVPERETATKATFSHALVLQDTIHSTMGLRHLFP
jgi:hypothetical protein